MRIGTLKTKHASLHLGHSDAIPEDMRPFILEVTAVHVDPKHRRTGQGRDLLRLACAQADVAGLVLILVPNPPEDSPMTAMQLEQWYHRLGFAVIQDDPKLMARQPNTLRVMRSANG